MPKNAANLPTTSDDAPMLTDAWFEGAHLMEGSRVVRRGRPKSEAPKKLVSLRLDPDVVDQFRATGPGWQSRINAALRKHIEKRG